MVQRLLVTGAAGFIGSNFVRYSLERHPECAVIGMDNLSYAGNLANLADIRDSSQFDFVHADICDSSAVKGLVRQVDAVVNFAAASMVDRSVIDPRPFVQSNFVGAHILMQEALEAGVGRFLQISTPEVYGQRLGDAALEQSAMAPRNIYASCKAGAEMLASAYFHSFGLPVVVTRGSNAVGPYQHVEKVLPFWITNALESKPLPLYGNGKAVRDWIQVDDLNAANDLVLRQGVPGEAYNVISGEERSLQQVATAILRTLGKPDTLIELVGDRPGHDYRYHMDATKVMALGWRPQHDFENTIRETVRWYSNNEGWWRAVKYSADFLDYSRRNYHRKMVASAETR
jgi:dTDP-glucose 4,6-dehydratase